MFYRANGSLIIFIKHILWLPMMSASVHDNTFIILYVVYSNYEETLVINL